jgi:hypothetical protein
MGNIFNTQNRFLRSSEEQASATRRLFATLPPMLNAQYWPAPVISVRPMSRTAKGNHSPHISPERAEGSSLINWNKETIKGI